MTLNKAQKENIQAAVEHFFYDMPREEKELCSEIESIYKALTQTNPSCKEEHKILNKILEKPTQQLNRLETFNNESITVKEVKIFLIDFINENIQKISKQHNYHFSENIWNVSVILKKINSTPSNDAQFISETVKSDNPYPYTIPLIPGQIFEGYLTVDANTYIIKAHVKINYSETESEQLIIDIAQYPNFNRALSDQSQDALLRSTAQNSYNSVCEKVATAVTKYLTKEKYITEGDSTQIGFNSYFLLTFHDYINMIKKSEISYEDIYHLTYQQTTLLTKPIARKLLSEKKSTIKKLISLTETELSILDHPGLVELMMNNITNMMDLLHLSDAQKKLLSDYHYLNLITNKALLIDSIIKLTDEQCNILLLPNYINIQKLNLASVTDILKLPIHAKKVISIQFYYDLIAKGKIKIASFEHMKKEHINDFSDKTIMTHIANGVISPNFICKMNSHTLTLITHDPFIKYILKNKLIESELLTYIDKDKCQKTEYKAFQLKENDLFKKPFFIKLLTDFCLYAKNHILYDSDLHCIFSDVNKHESFLAEKKESESKEIKLIDIPGITHKCITNIRTRIQHIIASTTKNDSIKELKKNCVELNIDINAILEKELYYKISSLYNPLLYNDAYFICRELINYGKSLDFLKDDVLIFLFSHRLFAKYENTPFKSTAAIEDTIPYIETELKNMTSTYNILFNPFHQSVVLAFLQKVKKQLLDVTNKTSETYEHYKIFIEKLTHLEKIQPSSSSARSESEFKSGLDSLMKEIDDTLKKLQKNNSASYLEPHQKRIKLNSSFLLPKYTLNSPQGLREFCEKMKEMSQIFHIKHPVLSSKRTVARLSPKL